MTLEYKFACEPLHQCEQNYEFSASYSYTPCLLKQGVAEDTSCTAQPGKFCSPGLVNFELPFINLRWFSLFKPNVSIANMCILRGQSLAPLNLLLLLSRSYLLHGGTVTVNDGSDFGPAVHILSWSQQAQGSQKPI